jgi:hypothetical protein
MPSGPYKQCATPPRRWYQVSWATPWQETYLAQTYFHKTEATRITLTKMYWLLGRKSKLFASNKLLIYKTILNPIWIYGIKLWGTASTSNLEILERFQSKTLHMIVDALWYMRNTVIQRDVQVPRVKVEVRCYSSQYSARLNGHPNDLIMTLMKLPDTDGCKDTFQMFCLSDS